MVVPESAGRGVARVRRFLRGGRGRGAPPRADADVVRQHARGLRAAAGPRGATGALPRPGARATA